MVKLIIDTKSKEVSELDIKGNTVAVVEELAHAVYKTLEELKMPDVETTTERFDLFHGALLAELVKEKGLSILMK